MAEAGSRRIVCITGMHRSGTSMVARVLQALGVYLGPEDRLMPPQADNPEGFFEHADLAGISEEVLAHFGGCWHDLPPLPEEWEASGALDGLAERAREIIERDFAGRSLWGWKDPRTAITLPFWRRILGPLQVVLCVRNPLDVARSHEVRDGFPHPLSLGLWTEYTARAWLAASSDRATIVQYERMLAQEDAAGWLVTTLELPTPDASQLQGALRTRRPELRHHASLVDDVEAAPGFAPAAKVFYRLLLECEHSARHSPVRDVAARAAVEDLALRRTIAAREQAHWAAHQRMAALEAEIVALSTGLSTTEAARGALENALAAERAAREDDRVASAASAAAIERHLGEIETALARQGELHTEALGLAAETAGVEASATWQIVRAARRVRAVGRRARMRLTRSQPARQRRRPANLAQQPLGVNVAGYIAAESGMGEATRASIRALEAAGIPVALNAERSGLRELDESFTRFDATSPHVFNLIHLNADNMAAFAGRRGAGYFQDRYSIGYWFWELEQFRDDWTPAFSYVNEVWVATAFTAAALAPHATVPVVCLPPAVVPPAPAPLGRDHFGLPPDAFAFLFAFDVSSQLERKNPAAVIRAFREARLGDRAVLVLKYTNGDRDPAAVRRLHQLADGLPVRFLDGYLSRGETLSLLAASDAYVSLHRAEGFGLTLAESMALGKPVIATNYSGNLEFMSADNSLLVDFRLVELDRNHGPYLRGFRWAEPDVAQAARLMRELVDEPGLARGLGQRAQADVGRHLGLAAAASRLENRLVAIQRGEARARGTA